MIIGIRRVCRAYEFCAGLFLGFLRSADAVRGRWGARYRPGVSQFYSFHGRGKNVIGLTEIYRRGWTRRRARGMHGGCERGRKSVCARTGHPPVITMIRTTKRSAKKRREEKRNSKHLQIFHRKMAADRTSRAKHCSKKIPSSSTAKKLACFLTRSGNIDYI